MPSEVPDYEDWETLVLEFSDVYDSPQDLRKWCENAGCLLPGERIKYRRATDDDADALLCPSDIRIMCQTYYGRSDPCNRTTAGWSGRTVTVGLDTIRP